MLNLAHGRVIQVVISTIHLNVLTTMVEVEVNIMDVTRIMQEELLMVVVTTIITTPVTGTVMAITIIITVIAVTTITTIPTMLYLMFHV
jgi:hypothetical protein